MNANLTVRAAEFSLASILIILPKIAKGLPYIFPLLFPVHKLYCKIINRTIAIFFLGNQR
jgi:hypothetical protein